MMNNERLRELEQQSVVYTDDDDDDGWDFDRWKFAELIVRECGNFTDSVTRKLMLQHFGVKE